MCRHLAYLGPPITLERLLLSPPHSLLRQSWVPRHQREGAINADGFGAGWFATHLRPEPACYRSAMPMWGDRSFASIAGTIESGAVLAAVRSATPPSPVVVTGNAPYTADGVLFSHNGAVDGFRSSLGEELRREVTLARAAAIFGVTDSEVVFALVLDGLDRGLALDAALVHATERVLARTTARLNLLATDGRQIVATTWGNSLWTLHDSGLAAGGVIVASEPFDDDEAWVAVPDASVVVADPTGVSIHAL
jgi:glutamine amidotransferase